MVNIFFNLFKHREDERNEEILYSFNQILSNKNIDKCYVFREDNVKIKKRYRWKVKIIDSGRPKFSDFFKLINKVSKDNDINIIINSDCFLKEDGVELIKKNIKHNEFYCISRHDLKSINPLIIGHMKPWFSQDCWVIKGKVRENYMGDFTMGIPKCDNVIAYEMKTLGYNLINPSKSINIYHYHRSEKRDYEKDGKTLYKLPEPYLYVTNISFDEPNYDKKNDDVTPSEVVLTKPLGISVKDLISTTTLNNIVNEEKIEKEEIIFSTDMNKKNICDEIDKYWYKDGHFNHNQRDFLITILQRLKPNYCLEIGFAPGDSCVTTLITSNPQKLITIDSNLDYMNTRTRVQNLLDVFLNLKIIEKNSLDVLTDEFFQTEFNNGIDFVFIDGSSKYEHVKNDITKSYEYLNKNGIILVDDYESGPPDGVSMVDVNNAVNDFIKENNLSYEKWYNNGKGFAIIKK